MPFFSTHLGSFGDLGFPFEQDEVYYVYVRRFRILRIISIHTKTEISFSVRAKTR